MYFKNKWTHCILSSRKLSSDKDYRISDVLLWTLSHDRARAGRPARTDIQLLCVDTGRIPEDLPEAMNDMDGWQERVRDIRADGAIWWWWRNREGFFFLNNVYFEVVNIQALHLCYSSNYIRDHWKKSN